MSNQLTTLSEVPDLSAYEVESVDLNSEYWTPEKEGETRRMLFAGVQMRSAPDHNDASKSVELPCAVFIEPMPDGQHKTVINGSKRLVAAFENNSIVSGTPVQIVYRGKKKNRTNAFRSDDWSIQTIGPKKGKGK